MNTRELATVLWVVTMLSVGLTRPGIRQSLLSIAKAFAQRTILVTFAAYIGLLGAAVYLAYRGNLWTPKLLTPTLFWFFLSGVVLLFGITEAGKRDRFFRTILLRTLGAGAFIEFLVGIKTFHILVELLLQPVVVVLVLLAAVVGTQPDLRPVKSAAGWLTGLIGIALLALTIRSTVMERATFDFGLQLRRLTLPIWLTLVSLPFLYVLVLYAEHQTAFRRMSLGPTRRKPSWPARLAVMIGLRGRLTEVHALGGQAAWLIGQERGYRGAREQVRAFRRGLEEGRASDREATDRLVRFAGVSGVDEHGRQLDRREFEETCSALEWLSSCHWGWYRRDDNFPGGLARQSRGLCPPRASRAARDSDARARGRSGLVRLPTGGERVGLCDRRSRSPDRSVEVRRIGASQRATRRRPCVGLGCLR